MNGRKGGIGVAERKLAEQVLQAHHRGSCRESVGKYEEPALWMAAQAGDTKICQQLLAARAEVNVRWKSWTPLMGAGRARAWGSGIASVKKHGQCECSKQKTSLSAEFCS